MVVSGRRVVGGRLAGTGRFGRHGPSRRSLLDEMTSSSPVGGLFEYMQLNSICFVGGEMIASQMMQFVRSSRHRSLLILKYKCKSMYM